MSRPSHWNWRTRNIIPVTATSVPSAAIPVNNRMTGPRDACLCSISSGFWRRKINNAMKLVKKKRMTPFCVEIIKGKLNASQIPNSAMAEIVTICFGLDFIAYMLP